MSKPECVLSLDADRQVVGGSTELLNGKIRAGADLRISTGFLHNEHIDPLSDDNQLVVETSTFAQTVLIDNRWSAYFMTLRQPVSLRDGFGRPHALSLFLYNQDGLQAMARLIMDEEQDDTMNPVVDEADMKKMHTLNVLDRHKAGASKNFIYNFSFYDFVVTDCYDEVYANTEGGTCVLGNIDALGEAYRSGRGIKLAVKGLSRAIWGTTEHEDEIYIHCGSSYYYTSDKLMITNTLPFVSVPADIPLNYKSESYRYCWLIARTDGRAEIRHYNVFDKKWETSATYLPIRWFAQA